MANQGVKRVKLLWRVLGNLRKIRRGISQEIDLNWFKSLPIQRGLLDASYRFYSENLVYQFYYYWATSEISVRKYIHGLCILYIKQANEFGLF